MCVDGLKMSIDSKIPIKHYPQHWDATWFTIDSSSNFNRYVRLFIKRTFPIVKEIKTRKRCVSKSARIKHKIKKSQERLKRIQRKKQLQRQL